MRMMTLPSSDLTIFPVHKPGDGKNKEKMEKPKLPVRAPRREVSTNQGNRYQSIFSTETIDLLRQWFEDHKNHPYPTADEKAVLAVETGLTVQQVNFGVVN